MFVNFFPIHMSEIYSQAHIYFLKILIWTLLENSCKTLLGAVKRIHVNGWW